ncbi:MAG: hypothetical protein ACRCXA_11900 [Peptostreptococcaceae bacterium]
MIKYLVTKAMKIEAEKMRKDAEDKLESGKKKAIYVGVTLLAGAGAYISYKVIKNYMFERGIDADLEYLESLEEYDEDSDDDYAYGISNEEKEEYNDEMVEKINEFNSRRLNCENDEIVSPEQLNHYIDQVKVDKDEVEINKDDFEEEKYDKYDE